MLRALALAVFVVLVTQTVGAQTPPNSDGWVVISVDEYRTLRLRAYPPEPPPEPPPVDAAVTRVDYNLRLGTGSIEGEATLVVDVFADGPVVVPLSPDVFVRAVRGARLMSLVGEAGQKLVLSKRGRNVVAFDVVAPFNASGGKKSITLRPGSMLLARPNYQPAVCRVALVLPTPDIDLSVEGGLLTGHPGSPDKPWVAYGTTAQPLTLTWAKRVEETRAVQTPRFRGVVTETVGLAEETGLITTRMRVEVTQGTLPAVTLALPDGLVVNEVSGPLVADWEFKPGSLRVSFLEPLSAETTVSISAEVPVSREGRITVPLVRLTGAERETGGIAVEVLGAGEITDRQPRGLDAADPSDLGDGLATRATPSMIAFRYRPQDGNGPRALVVNVLRYTPQAVLVANVEEARYDALIDEEGKVLVRARYAVRNNQRAFLGITLAEGAKLWSAVVAGRPLRPGAGPNGSLLVPLVKGRTGEDTAPFVVEVAYIQHAPAWTDEGRARLVLPALDLPVSRTGVLLRYSPRYAVKLEPGAFRVEMDSGPYTDALRRDVIAPADQPLAGVVGGVVSGLPEPPPSPAAAESSADKLIRDFRAQSAGRVVSGIVPVRVAFPEFGDTLFFVSELTAEGQAPFLELRFKRSGRW